MIKSTRPKKPIPILETTPVAKRTRSLKRNASLNELDSCADLETVALSDYSPDKTLSALKTKLKKKKKNLPKK
jgi:hypothetical protein